MVGSIARRNPPTCRLGERAGDVTRRLTSGQEPCAVVDDHDVVQGIVSRARLHDAGRAVEELMEYGPLTVRPSERLDRFVQRLERARIAEALVTTPDGRLWGSLSRAEAESAMRDNTEK